ncbi:hypothetical protein GT034_08940 [Streptomyces sp. SID2563]|nr:hypothetical protein [Streptomyces sp. SID2563]
MAKARGRPKDLTQDENPETVTRLLQLMHQVVTEPSPGFQIIVSDPDLPHTWFQTSVPYNWRGSEKLTLTTWLDTNPTPPHRPRHIPGTDEPAHPNCITPSQERPTYADPPTADKAALRKLGMQWA